MNFFITSCDSYDLPPKEHSLNTRENKYGPRPTYLGVHLSQIVQDTVQIKLSCTEDHVFSWLFNLRNRIKNRLNLFVANIKSDRNPKEKPMTHFETLRLHSTRRRGQSIFLTWGEGSGDYGRFTWFSGGVEDGAVVTNWIQRRPPHNFTEQLNGRFWLDSKHKIIWMLFQ